jgi:hypothetical protein
MQLLTIVGLACVNADLRNRLKNQGASGLMDFPLPFLLSEGERSALNHMQGNNELWTAFAAVGEILMLSDCANPPCPWDFQAADAAVRDMQPPPQPSPTVSVGSRQLKARPRKRRRGSKL